MISILFVSQTELFDSIDKIYNDFVTIYDGPNDKSNKIIKLEGYLGSFNITNTRNSLYIKFESDGLIDEYDNNGFLATIHYGNQYFNSKPMTRITPLRGQFLFAKNLHLLSVD